MSYVDKLPASQAVPIASLKPHPRNYKQHPEDQIEHLAQSIRENGFYRNVVVARDGTILAGRGVFEAAKKIGMTHVPAVRLDIDPDEPRAIKVMIADNEISHLAEKDDRLLSELLKEVKELDLNGLLGTGYDEMMLANLVMVTRPRSEVDDLEAAVHWAGLPEYSMERDVIVLVVKFRNSEDRSRFAEHVGETLTAQTKSIWWPHRDADDTGSTRLESASV